MAEMTIADITKALTAKPTATQKILSTPPPMNLSGDSKTTGGLQNIQLTKYETPISAVYDRLSDGSYSAKFENYLGATGNENRLALQQSAGEQWLHGVTKFGAKAINYATDSIIGTVVGIGSGLVSGNFSDVYDNNFSNWMDDNNKKLDNQFVNYYSDEQKSQGLLKNMLTANFWANDVGGGLAFVAGAVLPEIALGALTGGATLAAGGAKLGLRAGTKAAKEGAEAVAKRGILGKAADLSGFTAGRAVTKELFRAKLGSTVGGALDTGLFIARTSNFEAGMEARQNFKDAVDNYYTNFEINNGRTPSLEESTAFMEDARTASNGVYGANMAILSVSNAVMFGKKIVPDGVTNFFKPVGNFGNKLIGLGTKTEVVGGKLTHSLLGANRAQKITGNLYKTLRKPLTEGLYEEGFQGVAGKSMQNYLDAKYDPKNLDGYSVWGSVHDAFAEQYSSDEGWKEMGIGMIIGFLGGGMSPSAIKNKTAFEGFGRNSRKAAQDNLQTSLDRANGGLEALASMNRVSAVQAMAAGKKSGVNSSTGNFENSVEGYNFIKSQESINTLSTIQKDHNAIIDSLDFSTNEEMGEALASSGVTQEEYKDALKQDFSKTLDNYRWAQSSVKALGLERNLKDTPGNQAEVADAMMMTLMMGRDSLASAEKVGAQLDAIIGKSGIYSHLAHYDSLEEEDKDKVEKLQVMGERLDYLQNLSIELGNKIASTPAGKDQKDANTGRNVVSEQAVLTQQEIQKLTKEREELRLDLENKFDANSYNLEISSENKPDINVSDTLAELDKLDKLISSLNRSGKTKEANTIEYLVGQVRAFSYSHREMVQTHRKMLDSNYFSSKEGKGLINRILGKKYSISDDFRKVIKENDGVVSNSLNRSGIRNYESVEALFQAHLDANPDISDREKHRIEDLIRLQLVGETMQEIADTLADASSKISAEVEVEPTVLKGDTIALRESLNLKNKDLSNVEVLSKAIQDITEKLSFIINKSTRSQDEVEALKAELEQLKEQRDAIQKQKTNEIPIQPEAGVSETLEEGESQAGSQSSTKQAEEIKTKEEEEIEKRRQEEILKYLDTTFGSETVSLKEEREEQQKINAKYDAEIAALKLSQASTTSTKEITTEEYQDFVDNGIVSEERLDSIARKMKDGTELSTEELAIFTDKTSEINAKLVELKETVDTTLVEELEQNKEEIDQLIKDRLAKYDLPIFDVFSRITEAMERVINRAKMGIPVDVIALQEANDTLYDIYKDLVRLKQDENSGERAEKSLTIEYITLVQEQLAEEITYLTDYESRIKSGESLPTFEYSTESTTSKIDTGVEEGSPTRNPESTSEEERRIEAKNARRRVTPRGKESGKRAQLRAIDEIDAKIKDLEDRIAAVKESQFDIMASEDYKNFYKLTKKKETGELTSLEQQELDRLKQALDQWTFITGVVVEGFRLSDLIEQKVVLEETEINSVADVEIATSQDTLESSEFEDNTARANYSYGLVYDKVMASQDGDLITIYNITQDRFEDLIKGTEVTFLKDDTGRNNIVLHKDDIAKINENTSLRIIATNKNLTSKFVTVLEVTPAEISMSGVEEIKPLTSDYAEEFNGGLGHNIPAIFGTNPGDKVVLVIDVKDQYNRNLIAKYQNIKNKLTNKKNKFSKAERKALTEELKDAKSALRKSLLIHAEVNGNNVSTMKGLRNVTMDTQSDVIFEALRISILENEAQFDQIVEEGFSGKIEVMVESKDGTTSIPEITVQKILFGHPNYNLVSTEGGEIATEFRPISEDKFDQVTDIGYAEGGKTFTRDGKNVDTTYLKVSMKKNPKAKIPFIVLSVGGKRVAYPVKVGESKTVDTTEFEDIYNSDQLPSVKAKELNKILASNGVDIKENGNAFVSFGDSNLNDNFFQEKVAQLKAINYFYEVADWVGEKVSIESVLKTQVTVDIDVNNPFHSPKLVFDYSELDLKSSMTTVAGTKAKTASKASTAATTSVLYKGCK